MTVVFESGLPLADMKARLVLNRLSSRARVLATDPPAEKLDEVDPLSRFTVIVAGDSDPNELRTLADVEGVAEVRVHPADKAEVAEPAPVAPAPPPIQATATSEAGAEAASPSPPPAEPTPAAEEAPRRHRDGRRRGSPRRSGSTATGSIT